MIVLIFAEEFMTADFTPSNWNELIQMLYDIPKDRDLNRYRSDYFYRGLGDASWSLESSLMRLGGDYHKVEGALLRNFVKYAELGALPSDNFWVQLAIAQHHGLPTRLIDWTVSPQVALHFATAELEHYEKDGVIWCLDANRSRRDLPKEFWKILDDEYAYLFSAEMLKNIKSFREFDKYGQDKDFILFFEPPALDARIVNQGAILSAMPGVQTRLSDYLHRNPDLYQRIIIPRELKWEIRDKLDQDYITERSLFPGLDGLSRWLKRRYGPGGIS